MHKDKPPGLFEFAHRPVGHAVRLGLLSGFVLGVVVNLGLIFWRADVTASNPTPRSADSLETEIATKRPQPAETPTPTPAIRR